MSFHAAAAFSLLIPVRTLLFLEIKHHWLLLRLDQTEPFGKSVVHAVLAAPIDLVREIASKEREAPRHFVVVTGWASRHQIRRVVGPAVAYRLDVVDMQLRG